MNRLAVIALFVLATGGPARVEDEPKKAAEAFKGEWKVTTFQAAGIELPEDDLKKSKLSVDAEKMTLSGSGKDKVFEFSLDPKAKPSTIDLRTTEGGMEILLPGIYKLEKDQLSICFEFNVAGKRPKEFKSEEKTPTILLVMEKVKK